VLVPDSAAVRVPAGGSSVSTTWRTVGAGTAYIVATAPGYPADSSSLITVSIPVVNLTLDRSVGTGQQLTGTLSIPFGMPTGDTLFLTINNSAPGVLSMPAVDTIRPGFSSANFTAVGTALGTAITTVSAPGFTTSAPDTTQVGTPRLEVQGPNSGNSGTNASLRVFSQDQLSVDRPVDQPVVVTFTVDNTAIADFAGSATAQVTVATGAQASPFVTLNLKSPGNVTITATAAGYTNGIRIITVN
jgi:hypothetical protein